MKEKNKKSICIRTTENEAAVLRHNAEKCGMSITQFLILRGLGYEPQPLPPVAYYHFMEKLDSLKDYGIPSELNLQISALTEDIRNKMVDMRKEDLKEWLSQVSGR